MYSGFSCGMERWHMYNFNTPSVSHLEYRCVCVRWIHQVRELVLVSCTSGVDAETDRVRHNNIIYTYTCNFLYWNVHNTEISVSKRNSLFFHFFT